MRTRHLFFLLLSLSSTAWAQAADFRSFDHADPWQLNEAAADALAQPTPDLGTARILLERAALLAPEQAEIQANREALRRLQDGRARLLPALTLPATANTSATSATSANLPAEEALPELWPR